MFRKPFFWIVFILLTVAGILFAVKQGSRAYPIVSLDLKMSRPEALKAARELAQKYGWGPEDFQAAASFGLDEEVRDFVELEAGGPPAFRRMLKEGFYFPYTWEVRLFREGETNETSVWFTPEGTPCGFIEILAEDKPGATLAPDEARSLAEKAAATEWHLQLTDFQPVESAKELRPGGRMDHTFVYERRNAVLGEGRYRLTLAVSGDRLTGFTHFVKVPEAFSRRYEEMRSANNTIAGAATAAIVILYGLGGCLFGVFFLLRRRLLVWREPLGWGFLVAFIGMLAAINQWPLIWMNYDTALSREIFILRYAVRLAGGLLNMGVLLTVSFAAAEGLTRAAFPRHLQLWPIWSTEAAASPAVLGRTIGGYLGAGLLLAYEAALYAFAHRTLGWWTPTDTLSQPDMLAAYFPWFSPIAGALQAGFWEECLFRAVPLAGAALVGQRLGRRRLAIGTVLVAQAIIFSAAHANYPNQPAYARLVELILPSLAWGGSYLAFGLLPAIIMHFVYDAVLMSMPLFVSTAPGIQFGRVILALLVLVPLLVVLRAGLRRRKWTEVPEKYFNYFRQPAVRERPVPAAEEETATTGQLHPRWFLAAGIAGLLLWLFAGGFRSDAPPLKIGRAAAEKQARQALAEKGAQLPPPWRALSWVSADPDLAHDFVWREGGEQAYRELLGTYLTPPCWQFRFVRFTGEVAERAEEYQVSIAADGEPFAVFHQLPEARAGKNLEEAAAREIADAAIREHYRKEPGQLKRVSAEAARHPARTDWVFVAADPEDYRLGSGEARIVVEIAGDEVTGVYRYLHVPEEWERKETNRRSFLGILKNLCAVPISLLYLYAVAAAIFGLGRKTFPPAVFGKIFVLFFVLGLAAFVNRWPVRAAFFSTAEPLNHQVFNIIAGSWAVMMFFSAAQALVLGWAHGETRRRSRNPVRPGAWTGFALGTLIYGWMTFLDRFDPVLSPSWAEYSAAGTLFPVLDVVLDVCLRVLEETGILLLFFAAAGQLTGNWSKRKIPGFLFLLLIGLFAAGTELTENVPFWIISGLARGLTLFVAYRFIFRFQPALIPPAAAAMVILEQIRQASVGAYPGAIAGSLLGIVLAAALALFWFRLLSREEILPATGQGTPDPDRNP